MSKDSHAVALLSGELSIEQRAAIINRFRNGKEKVLITTNVSARGEDILGHCLVIVLYVSLCGFVLVLYVVLFWQQFCCCCSLFVFLLVVNLWNINL
jgi:hypothetical protein